jgi:hypothetical protein
MALKTAKFVRDGRTTLLSRELQLFVRTGRWAAKKRQTSLQTRGAHAWTRAQGPSLVAEIHQKGDMTPVGVSGAVVREVNCRSEG